MELEKYNEFIAAYKKWVSTPYIDGWHNSEHNKRRFDAWDRYVLARNAYNSLRATQEPPKQLH